MSIKRDHKEKMLKTNGPRTELYGTVKIIFSHLLFSLIILTFYSLLLWWNYFQRTIGHTNFIRTGSFDISSKKPVWVSQFLCHFHHFACHFFNFLFCNCYWGWFLSPFHLRLQFLPRYFLSLRCWIISKTVFNLTIQTFWLKKVFLC